MSTYADQTKENKSESVASSVSQMQTSEEATFEFIDHRSDSVAQRKLQHIADGSSQVSQLKSFQELADNSFHAKQVAQLQSSADTFSGQQHPTIQRQENKTGLPDNLKSGIENLSGHSMDDVKVHYNSDKPAQLQAHAYAQGTDIHLASGQEKHLPHEAWHVVQQKEGRVKPTMQMKGKVNINDDPGLEREADVMGEKAMSDIQSIQRKKYQKTPSTSNFNSFQRVALNTNDVIQRAIVSIGDVNRQTKLRERPKNDSPTRGNNIIVGKNVLKVDDPTAVIDDESGSENKWLDVEVIAGDEIGFSGYLRYEKYRAATFQPDEDNLGYVTAKTKLRSDKEGTKTSIDLKPGDLFEEKEKATEQVPFAQVWIGTGDGRNMFGWLREGKMMKRKNPLVPDIHDAEDLTLTASEERTAPTASESIELDPTIATEETSKEELKEALADLGRKQNFFEYEIEQGGKPAGSVAAAMERVETFFTSEATAQQRLRKDNVTTIVQQKAQSEADVLYFKLLEKTRGFKQDINRANLILNQDLSQSSIEQTEAAVFLQVGLTKYSEALEVYGALKETYEKLTSDDDSSNPIIKETLALAKKELVAEESRLEWGGELLGYSGESLADGTSEGGEASLSGLFGARTTQGAHGDDARITGAVEQYDDQGNSIDKQDRQGYNSMDSGAIGLGSEGYKSFTDTMSSFVQESSGWMKALGFLQDLSVTPQGISATVKKLSIIKPFPPLASALISIPLYPGVGVKLEAKAKASVSLSAAISINWGDWLTSGKKNQAGLDALYNKQKTELGKKQLLKNKLRDGSQAEKERASKDYQVVGKELQVLTASISKQQKQLSMWSRDMTLKVKGTGNANASIGGEFFGGIFLGIPVVNVSGGLYGEIGAAAKASIGIDGTFERKDGDWYKSANLTFDLNGGLNAEVGAKANYQILFFSGDIAKFTFGEWNIASFFVRGKKGLGSKADPLTNPDGIEKKVMWFKGAPPIETRVEESKDKANDSVKVVSDKVGDKLSVEQNSDFEKVHTAVEAGGAAAGMAAQLASLKQKKENLESMSKEGRENAEIGGFISGEGMSQRAMLEREINELKASLVAARDAQDADLTELSELLSALEEKQGSKFSKKQTVSESAEKEVGSFRTLSDTYFNQAQKKTFNLSRQLVISKTKFDDAKLGLDGFLALNNTTVNDYRDFERLVIKKEEAIGTQKQTVKDLELQKSGIKNQKKKSSEGGAEAELEKQRTLKRIDESLTEEKAKLAAYERVLKTLKNKKTKVRNLDKANVGEYKTFRNALRVAKNQYESIIEEMERINIQMLKARSFAEEANVLDAQLKDYAEKIAEVKKYKNLMVELQSI